MQSFDFTTLDYDEVTSFIKENGYVVINNLFSKTYCDSLVERTINAFQTISPNLDHRDPKKWNNVDLPPQIRTGMYQSLISNINPVREVRENENYKRIFSEIYSRIKTSYNKGDDLISSIDGINFKPNVKSPYYKNTDKRSGSEIKLKGMTSINAYKVKLYYQIYACFVCSPKSHKIHEEILNICEVRENDSDDVWHKIKKDKYSKCKEAWKIIGGLADTY